MAVASTMKSLLGPKSMDKLLVDSSGNKKNSISSNLTPGDLLITNDGATALSAMVFSQLLVK
jgi:chaperonin GroEL (HSP60 family)